MISFSKPMSVWGTPAFENALKGVIEKMTAKQLPLQQALSSSSYALDTSINAVIINITEEEKLIRIKAGIFYTGIIAGCNCADDPSPADELPEYCVVQFEIDKSSAEANVTLINEETF